MRSGAAASRLTPLRGLRRYAASFFLSLLTMIFIVVGAAQAQTYFNFGSSSSRDRSLCPGLVFWYDGDHPYTVTLSVAGMVFDHNLQYSRQLSEMTTITFEVADSTESTGFYHSNQTGLTPPASLGDVSHTRPERLGAGRYHIVTDDGTTVKEVMLDLTDANWADGSGGSAGFRNIRIDPYNAQSTHLTGWISDADPEIHTLISCGDLPFISGGPQPYWVLVRKDWPDWKFYARNRSGFIINPAYRGPHASLQQNIPQIPYGLTMAKLDVDVEVTDDVEIPSGKTWIVTTDTSIINSPYIEQTLVMFNSGTGLNVKSGGALISVNSGRFGVVDWYSYADTTKGIWRGIVGEPGSTISMSAATISDAILGLRLNQTTTYNMEVLLVDNCQDYGIHISDCPTEMTAVGVSGCGSSGGAVYGSNVKIEGSKPSSFTVSAFSDAVSLTGGPYDSGHGVDISCDGENFFTNCVLHGNEGCGYAIRDSGGVYIYDNDIRYNAVGVYALETAKWLTLRESKVHDNTIFGVRMSGTDSSPVRLRGWYHPNLIVDPSVPGDVDSILNYGEIDGLNCVYHNEENLRAEYARYDLGSQYRNSGGVDVLLGSINSIFDPTTGGSQSLLYGDSYGGFRGNWWDTNHNITAYNPATYDDTPELQSDSVGCIDMGKSVADGAGSLAGDLLLYRRTRGSMQLPSTRQEVRELPTVAPATMYLAEPYPNPFNPRTSIAVTLFERQDITLTITDALGRTVATLANGHYDAGRYSVTFDAGNLPSGMYHVVLRGGNSVQSRRLLLTK